jgi:hypothetical protein
LTDYGETGIRARRIRVSEGFSFEGMRGNNGVSHRPEEK